MLRDDTRIDAAMRVPVTVGAVEAGARSPHASTDAAWRTFHGRLRAFVRRRVRHAADADDIVQRVFLQMHRALPAVPDGGRLGAWLYRAARNAIADHYRAPVRRREVLAGDTRTLDAREDSDVTDAVRAVEIACAAGCLRSLIEQLPARYRDAIESVELRGLSQAAVAAVRGLSVSGMKSRVQRGRSRLKAMLLEHCDVALDGRGGIVACGTRGSASRSCGSEP